MNPDINKEVTVEEDGTSIIKLLQVVAENLRVLVVVPIAVGLVALGGAFLIEPTFTAKVTFLPPQQQSGASNLLQSLGSLGGVAGAASGLKNPIDQYISFLKSNAVEDELVRQFDLQVRYKEKLKSEARKALEMNTRIAAGKDNIVSLEFDDKDPVFAANVANAYADELTKLLGRLSVTEAQQRRAFFGKQLETTKNNLIQAERALAATGVSVATLNANPSTALEGPARLRAQVTAQAVKLAAMRSYLAEGAPEFRQALAELNALRQELAKAERSQVSQEPGGGDYIAKYRDFKYQETLQELYSRQYELARVDESREGALVQVVDAAQPPEKKSKPKKATIALASTLGTLFVLLILIFLRNTWRAAAANQNSAFRMVVLKATLRQAIWRR